LSHFSRTHTHSIAAQQRDQSVIASRSPLSPSLSLSLSLSLCGRRVPVNITSFHLSPSTTTSRQVDWHLSVCMCVPCVSTTPVVCASIPLCISVHAHPY